MSQQIPSDGELVLVKISANNWQPAEMDVDHGGDMIWRFKHSKPQFAYLGKYPEWKPLVEKRGILARVRLLLTRSPFSWLRNSTKS